jgi:hypothetical protein
MNTAIHVSAITSFCVSLDGCADAEPRSSPAKYALTQLRKWGIQNADLYCFMPGDLPALALAETSPPRLSDGVAANIAALDVDKLIRHFRRVDAAPPRSSWFFSERRIKSIATNLPNISNPDAVKRQETVDALKKLLEFAGKIGAPTLEVVSGPNFVRRESPTREWPLLINTSDRVVDMRRRALVDSLLELNDHALRLTRRVAIVLEMEPGLSYLLNSWEEVKGLFRLLDQRITAVEKRRVFLNLDIGHARLMAQTEPWIFLELHQPEWRSRIAHAHISHHELPAHMADLPLRPEHEDIYQPWIDLVVDAWLQRGGCPLASRTIALELEAHLDRRDVETSVDCLQQWVSKSTKRYRGDRTAARRSPGMAPKVGLAGGPNLRHLSTKAAAPGNARQRKVRPEIFISYAHQDKEWLNELQTTLKANRISGARAWSDRQLDAGDTFEKVIQEKVGSARLAILLVTRAFMASKFIQEKELPWITRRAKASGLRVLWILISSTGRTPRLLKKTQALWSPDKPLLGLRGNAREKAWSAIGENIQSAVASLSRQASGGQR